MNVIRFREMASLPPLLLVLWVISGAVQFCILFLVITKRHFEALPMFSVYVTLNLCQAAFLFYLYSRFGFTSPVTRELGWLSELITLAAQALAATELIHRVLRHYQGIWALAWRLIATATVVVIAYAVANAQLTPAWILMISNRGYHLTFAVAMIACLLLIRYYSIPVDPVFKTLMGGFCVFSCVAVAANTFLQADILRRLLGELWNYLDMVVFIGVQIAWAVALRHRVRMETKPPLLPPSTYGQISPELNSRLRALNELLSKFLRWQVLRP